jgi:hypothetical protein
VTANVKEIVWTMLVPAETTLGVPVAVIVRVLVPVAVEGAVFVPPLHPLKKAVPPMRTVNSKSDMDSFPLVRRRVISKSRAAPGRQAKMTCPP